MCFIVALRCPWDSWDAWFIGLHACTLEELPHCIPRSIPGKGEVLVLEAIADHTTYGFGMLCLVLWVVAMTSIFSMSVHSTNSSWMVHIPKLIFNLLLTNKYSTSYFIWWMEYTHNLVVS